MVSDLMTKHHFATNLNHRVLNSTSDCRFFAFMEQRAESVPAKGFPETNCKRKTGVGYTPYIS